jgi:hypothetical protein
MGHMLTKRNKNDILKSAPQSATFYLESVDRGEFRMIRIPQTGKNQRNDNVFILSMFEIL